MDRLWPEFCIHAHLYTIHSGGVLGGVARYTNDVVLLCQSAGFDIVFIETVGRHRLYLVAKG